jgi:catalase
MVGNNFPVFFIQDAIKFPDFVHTIKPKQDKQMPQASTAHDTLWDFLACHPETAHMIG